MANFNLYLGQDVKLTPKAESDLEHKAEVIAKDKTGIDLKIIDFKQENISVFKPEEEWTIAFEGTNSLNQLDVKIENISTRFNLVLTVSPIGEVQKIERRRYTRAKISAPIKYRDLNSEEMSPARLIDISASGIKMEIETIIGLKMEKEIIIDFSSLDDFPVLEIQARILRIKVNQNSQGKIRKYYAGLEFVSVGKDEREELIDWVQERNQ